MDRKYEKLKRTPGLRTFTFDSSTMIEKPVPPSRPANKPGKPISKIFSTPRTSLAGITSSPIEGSSAAKSPSFRVSQLAKIKAETQSLSSLKDLIDFKEKLTKPNSPFYRSSTPSKRPSSTPRNQQPSPRNHQALYRQPHANTGNKNLKALPATGNSKKLTDPAYPASVLKAARTLESVLPPYLVTSPNPEAGLVKDAKITNTPLRPRAGSDDSTRLTTLLESAHKLVVHLSTKKVEGDKSLMLQAELLRIVQQKEATIKLLRAEMRRWKVAAGN
ncbi:hypothetical protein DV735_g2139, partial [Chaetothyriales sp. CBS 134920]